MDLNDNLEIGTEEIRWKSTWIPAGGVVKTRVSAGMPNNVWHSFGARHNGSDNKLDLYVDGTKIHTWTQFGGPLIVPILHLCFGYCLVPQTKWGEFQDGSMIFVFMIPIWMLRSSRTLSIGW